MSWFSNKVPWFGNKQVGFLANDGVRYTDEQYVRVVPIVRFYLEDRGWHIERIAPLKVVGSLSIIASKEGYGRRGFSFYMRDLITGRVRKDGADDYFVAVRLAGVV